MATQSYQSMPGSAGNKMLWKGWLKIAMLTSRMPKSAKPRKMSTIS